MFVPPTTVKEIVWPALPTPTASSMLAVQHQLEQSQWASPDEIRSQQFAQLDVLINYAYRNVPYYKDSFDQADFNIIKQPLTEFNWQQIPILKRSDIQNAGMNLHSKQIPKGHGKIGKISTSGSTGRTVKIIGTSITNFFWHAFNLRDQYWHQRVLSGKHASIKLMPEKLGKTINGDSWGPPIDMVYKSGKSCNLSIKTSISEQVQWLQDENPDYLLTYPSNVVAIVKHLQRIKAHLPALREIRTLGETVTPEIRKLVRDYMGVSVTDIYSCQESGSLAIQCPRYEHYHVQSENIYLEVLNEDDAPCNPGETGRVVITALHNFASPLIRYDIGDYAEVGDQCDCGRGLPVLKQIMGRVRNIITYPDGSQAWPLVGSDSYNEIAQIQQFQFIQKSVNDIEVKLVVGSTLTDEQQARLKERMQSSLRYPFNIEFTFHDKIPRNAGGKFEDFMSLL